ncbi:MAG: MBL fold metallo-hydrolase [Acidobacteriota bacterium]|nr:MBL fold metallo-hydrolase [Acidobacteriota bacterium]
MRINLRTAVGVWLGLSVVAQAQSADTLNIYMIDVEGGEATLFVSPAGESMLVDTGWPGFDGRDADRIAAAAADAGVSQIDHLVVTHFHGDHMGGSHQLAERLSIQNFVDHGVTVDTGDRQVTAFEHYAELRRGSHRAVKPGDNLGLEGLDVRIIASDGNILDTPLPGAGAPNPFCDGFVFHGDNITSRYGDAEDQLSVSVFVGHGAFRTVIMGDLTWNKEHALMCPDNKVGAVDLYLVSHHGSDTSGSEALVQALRPRVGVMNNGPRKGGAVQTFQILGTVETLEDLWQNHYSVPGGAEHNAPEEFIANLQDFEGAEENSSVHLGDAYWIHIAARSDGSFTVTNSRNGFSRSYGARE